MTCRVSTCPLRSESRAGSTYHLVTPYQISRLLVDMYQICASASSPRLDAQSGQLTQLLLPLEHIQPPVLERLPRFWRLVVLEFHAFDCIRLLRQQTRAAEIRLDLDRSVLPVSVARTCPKRRRPRTSPLTSSSYLSRSLCRSSSRSLLPYSGSPGFATARLPQP